MTRSPAVIAAVLVGLQSALGMLAAGVLFAGARHARRWLPGTEAAHHRTELAWIILVLALGALAIAIGIASAAGWAQIGAICFEALVIVVDVLRLGRRPGASVLSIALAVTVIVLVVSIHRAGAPAAPAPPAAGASG